MPQKSHPKHTLVHKDSATVTALGCGCVLCPNITYLLLPQQQRCFSCSSAQELCASC